MLVRYTLSLPAQHSRSEGRARTSLSMKEGKGKRKGGAGSHSPIVSQSRSLLFSSFPPFFVSCGKNAYPFHIPQPTPCRLRAHVCERMRDNTKMSWVNIDFCESSSHLEGKSEEEICGFVLLDGNIWLAGWQADGWRNLSCGAIICHHRKSRRGGGSPLLSCCIMCRLRPGTVSWVNIGFKSV